MEGMSEAGVSGEVYTCTCNRGIGKGHSGLGISVGLTFLRQ